MDAIAELESKKLSKRGLRLLKEWKDIDELCHDNVCISYAIRKRNPEGLPIVYEIKYNIRSIIGVKEAKEVKSPEESEDKTIMVREPVFGKEHIMRIQLPNNYPSAQGNPDLTFITDIWHPNVRSAGNKKGHVCSNDKDLGVTAGLAERIIRVGKYLQYQLYHALDTPPYPEDDKVAQWVLNEAEPMGWVNMAEGIFVDHTNLFERKQHPKREEEKSDKKETQKESGEAGDESHGNAGSKPSEKISDQENTGIKESEEGEASGKIDFSI